jgi:hypothetical protein
MVLQCIHTQFAPRRQSGGRFPIGYVLALQIGAMAEVQELKDCEFQQLIGTARGARINGENLQTDVGNFTRMEW